MSYRPAAPVRCAALIDAPEAAVRRALGSSQVWIRAARAVGGRLQVAGNPRRLRSGALVRFTRVRGSRPILLRVGESAGLPVLTSASTYGLLRVRIESTLAETGAGTSATVELTVGAAVPMFRAVLRPTLSRYGEMLLGIAALAAREPIRVVAAALITDGAVLLARRKSSGTEPGRWELPGGKVEPGETDRAALARELCEELALRATVHERLGPVVPISPGVELYCYRVSSDPGADIALVDHEEHRWVGPDELGTLDLLEADRQLIDAVRSALGALS